MNLGLVLVTLFVVGLFVVLNSYLLVLGGWEGPVRFLGCGILVGSIAWAFIDLLSRTRPARVEAEAALRERLLRQGVVAYLQDELSQAEEAFRGMLKIDPHDPEAWFRLAVLACRRGEARAAARRFARLRRCDTARKWEWEIRCEQVKLRDRAGSPEESRRPDAGISTRQETAQVTVG